MISQYIWTFAGKRDNRITGTVATIICASPCPSTQYCQAPSLDQTSPAAQLPSPAQMCAWAPWLIFKLSNSIWPSVVDSLLVTYSPNWLHQVFETSLDINWITDLHTLSVILNLFHGSQKLLKVNSLPPFNSFLPPPQYFIITHDLSASFCLSQGKPMPFLCVIWLHFLFPSSSEPSSMQYPTGIFLCWIFMDIQLFFPHCLLLIPYTFPSPCGTNHFGDIVHLYRYFGSVLAKGSSISWGSGDYFSHA